MKKPRRSALLIGVGAYRLMSPLRPPLADAQAMARVLALNGDFECKVLPDPDFTAMRSAVVEHFSDLNPPDTGLLFFSGHGIKDSGELYLCPIDMDPAKPRTAGLPGEEIRHCIGDPKGALCHIIILDCCYAGAITKSDPAAGQDNEPPRRQVFDPGSGSGVVYFAAAGPRAQAPAQSKGPEAVANSPYTGLLLEGLNGAAGGDDPYVTPQALDRFLKRAARERGLGLKPSYSANNLVDDDKIHLTQNPMPGLGRLPDFVREALDAPNASARIGACFLLSLYAGNADEPQLANFAQRMLETRQRREMLQDGRVSEAIRSMLRALEATAEQSTLQQRLDHANSERAELQTERDRLIEQLKEGIEKTNGLKAEHDRLIEDLRGANENAVRLNTERDHLIEQLKKANESEIGLKAERDQLIEQLKKANEAEVALKAVRDQLIEQLQEANESANQRKFERDQAIKQLAEVSETETRLKTERDLLIAQLKVAIENGNGLRDERDQITEQLKESIESTNGLKTERGRLIEELKAATENGNGLRDERDRLIEQLKEASGDTDGLKIERDRLIEQLKAAIENRDALRDERDRISDERNRIIEQLSGPSGVQLGTAGGAKTGWRRKSTPLISAAVGALLAGVLYEGYLIPQYIKQQIIAEYEDSAKRNGAFGDRNKLHEGRDTVIQDRDQAIKDRDAAFKARDQALRDRNGAIQERHDAEATRDTALKDLDTALKDLKQAQEKRDEAVRALAAASNPLSASNPPPDGNATNVTPSGRPWTEDDTCRGYLSNDRNSWSSRWQLDRRDGTYHVWVFSDPNADEESIDAIKDRFNQAFPTLSFEKLHDTHSATWGIIVAGGLTNLQDAKTICHFARACVRADSNAWRKGPGGRSVCP